MRQVKILKPSKGLIIINPLTGLKLEEEGNTMVMSTYWVRRIKCGDVIEVKKEKKVSKKNNNKKIENIKE